MSHKRLQNKNFDVRFGQFVFTWFVPAGGIELRADLEPSRLTAYLQKGVSPIDTQPPFLVPADGTQGLREYAPLQLKDLHRRFARLDITLREPLRAVAGFAARYGFLHGSRGKVYLANTGGKEVEVPVTGESLSSWESEIATMARLVRWWDAVRREDRGFCGNLIGWSYFPRAVELHWPSGARDDDGGEILNEEILASGEVAPNLLELLDPRWGDPVEPLRYVIHREVNKRLRGHVAPQVMPFWGGEIYLWPDSLLSAMYVLFALELTGRNGPWCTCKGCGDPYIREHGSQRYCTPGCQKRTWDRANRSKLSKRD